MLFHFDLSVKKSQRIHHLLREQGQLSTFYLHRFLRDLIANKAVNASDDPIMQNLQEAITFAMLEHDAGVFVVIVMQSMRKD